MVATTRTSLKGTAFAALAVYAFASVSASPIAAQEHQFRLASVFPESHLTYVESIKYFMDEVGRASNGAITFETYPGGQLGRNTGELIGSGLADMGLVLPSYEPENFPLSSVVELPGFHSTACEGTAKFWKLAQEGGALYEREYAPADLHPIFVFNLQPYNIQTRDKQITSLEDLAGMKIRANGSAQQKTVTALGAVPVAVTGPETYDALSRGTIDGSMFVSLYTENAGLGELLKFGVVGTQLGSGGGNIMAMKKSIWDDLDEQTKAILKEAGMKTQEHMCVRLDEGDVEAVAMLKKDRGYQTNELAPEELARWEELVMPVVEQWAAEVDATGRPGSEMLEIYRATTAD